MFTGNNPNTNSKDHFDLQQQKKILKSLIPDLQKKKQQKNVQIVYDPVNRISQLYQVVTIHQPKVEEKKQRPVIDAIKNFITSCTQLCKSDKKQAQFSIKSILFQALKTEQTEWLEKHYGRYKQQQLSNAKTQYIHKMNEALIKVRHLIQIDPIDQSVKQPSLQSIQKLQKLYDTIQPGKIKTLLQFIFNNQKQYLFMIMISAYKIFQPDYSPYKRSKLKLLYKQLQKGGKFYNFFNNSIEVLRFLQSKDPLLAKLELIQQLDLNIEVVKGIDKYLSVNNKTQEEIKTRIGLVKVSQSRHRRRIVNLLISGFLSQDVDKRQQWNQLLSCMPDSQVYGLQWQSHTINRLIKFLTSSVKDVILGKQLNELITKDNPFIPAYDISIQAGQMLAYVVHRIFPFQFINIISYSLGSQLIRSFLQKTIQLNNGKNINKVIMMGGVSDVYQFQKTISKTNQCINILNVRTKHDSVLKYILKRAKPNVKPLGLHDLNTKIKNHIINNLEVSKQINGHFSFMTNFGTIAELLTLNQQ